MHLPSNRPAITKMGNPLRSFMATLLGSNCNLRSIPVTRDNARIPKRTRTGTARTLEDPRQKKNVLSTRSSEESTCCSEERSLCSSPSEIDEPFPRCGKESTQAELVAAEAIRATKVFAIDCDGKEDAIWRPPPSLQKLPKIGTLLDSSGTPFE